MKTFLIKNRKIKNPKIKQIQITMRKILHPDLKPMKKKIRIMSSKSKILNNSKLNRLKIIMMKLIF